MSPSEDITNADIFLWGLHDLGGGSEFIDVEAVFLKCFDLAPRRFAWRTRDDLPDYKKCSKALRDAEARRPSLLVKTGDGLGRQLSVEGQKWVEVNTTRLTPALTSAHPVQEPRQRPRSRMLAQAEQAKAFQDWQAAQQVPAEKWQMAELLRCSPDSDVAVWRNRLENLRAAAYAGDRKDLLEFLDYVARAHGAWFEGGSSR